jgi:GNAT superfamily N-acetyltransferase
VGELLAEAFQEPVTFWLVPDAEHRPAIMTTFFGLVAEDSIRGGTVDVIGDYEGTAVWFDMAGPAHEPEEPDLRYTQAFGRYGDRWDVFDQLTSSNHPHGAPHHYLMLVGIRPDRQGQGLGRALLEHHHETVAGPAGLPTYLEATSTGSRRLYQRLGYQDLRDPLQLPDGPPIFPMWRPAGGVGEPLSAP